jgi:hypothetical protein
LQLYSLKNVGKKTFYFAWANTKKMSFSQGAIKRQANAIRNDNGTMELQLFNDMLEWPTLAGMRPTEFFFSRNYKGKNLKLTTKAMVERMKATAASQRIDPTLISAKSLRKAFGTDLTRSDMPSQTINTLGRWAKGSKTCGSHYAHAAPGNVTGTMSDGISRTSNDDVRRLDRSRSKLIKESTVETENRR